MTIVIDAGHGGNDTGVIINNLSEKDIVYNISQKIKAFENENIEIILLRDNDSFLSLKDRVEKINTIEPDLVISLHLDNSKDENSKGTKAYIHKNKLVRTSHFFASNILKQLNINTNDIEFANFYLLKHSNSPAVNLYLGNFSNKEDKSFLTSELGQNYVAKQIFQSLE
jgi:N-acetylmuramoyl-L-alanine amidase